MRKPLITVWLIAAAGTAAQDHGPENTSSNNMALEAARSEEVRVYGPRIDLVGEAISASQGLVTQRELALRPLLRTGEIMESVPGMIATQHSGTGKANQYFLRGFNLDHGTDFATWYDGMPVNMRSHGHGQGYTDLNFIIPELVEEIAYRKGGYYADVGDFSGAGSAHLHSFEQLDSSQLSLSTGEDDYYRLLALNSVDTGPGTLLSAFAMTRYQGPWRDVSEDLEQYNAVLKYSWSTSSGRFSVSAMGYHNRWNSADQIPRRAVNSGQIGELGSLDEDVGGESSRSSVSLSWQAEGWRASAYAIRYDLTLWSNFTYFLDHPTTGDEFEQRDDRWLYGGRIEHHWQQDSIWGEVHHRIGLQARYDDIRDVGLFHSRGRARIGAIRRDAVEQGSAGLFYENVLHWTPALRTVLGLRYDHYDFEVADRAGVNVNGVDLSANTGSTDDGIVSPKLSVIYTASDAVELYASAGQGFHSNDARGTTAVVDPADGGATAPVDPLVQSEGAELGARLFLDDRLNASLALWWLDLDSELLFVGDAGNTEASRASRRKGIELSAYYRLHPRWTLDLEYAWTDAQFSQSAPGEGDEIDGAPEHVASAGVSADYRNWFGSLRLRYFGKRPLDSFGNVESDSTTVVNLLAGWRVSPAVTLQLEVLNLLDSDDHDIDYFYASRLPGEPAGGVEDQHYHVMEPRTLRAGLTYHW